MAPAKFATTPSPTKGRTCEAFARKGKNVEVLITVLLSTKRPDAFGLDASQVDWDLVAQRLSLKSARVASTRFGQVKKELIECAESMNLTSGSNSGVDAKAETDGISPPGTPTKVKPDPEHKKRGPKGKTAKSGAKNGGGRGRGKKIVKFKEEREYESVAEPGVESGEEGTESTEE